MRFDVCAVTHDHAVHASTLHLLVGLNAACQQRGWPHGTHFVSGPADAARVIEQADRMLWVGYGTGCGAATVDRMLEESGGWDVLVFPAPSDGVDWERFRVCTLGGSSEPPYQRGLRFDTEVGESVGGPGTGLRRVLKTRPALWLADCTRFRNRPGAVDPTRIGDLIAGGREVLAWTPAQVTRHFVYEAVGSALDAPGIRHDPAV